MRLLHFPQYRSLLPAFGGVLLLGLLKLQAVTSIPGDLNDDFDTTVADIAILVSHIQGTQFLEAEAIPYVDFDQNGILNSVDVEVLVQLVMDSQGPQVIPTASIKSTLPQWGESNVGVKRETVFYFTLPLAEDTVISNDNFFALFGGEKLLTRIEVSSDRMKATLFYLDPLPDNARVRVVFDGAGIKDIIGRDFDPDRDGEPGGLYGLDFNTVSITELLGTAISGTVFRSKKNELDNDVPLAGVVIEVVGAEETIRTTTAGDGSFTLDPCPGGRFFVNIDGRPVTGGFPTGDYYPFVGKAWYAQPGRTDNLVNKDGKIYLPLIAAGSLKTVSQTENTVIEFPQGVLDENPSLNGVRVTVPQNSLFNEDGVRGGMVGIAPVAPDRIPEPLPDGLTLPIVITVQTDGPANFDQPAPVVFPNLPNPATGLPLPAGSKSALLSFNHDSGEWEIAGPMTVSADGLLVSTDPGVGIRQPGWHGTFPWTSMGGGGANGRRSRGPRDDDCNDPNGCPPEEDELDPEEDCKTKAKLAISGVVQGALNTAMVFPKSLPAGTGFAITAEINLAGAHIDSHISPSQSDEFFKGAAYNTALATPTLLFNPPSPDPASRAAGVLATLPSLADSWINAIDRGIAFANCGGGSSSIVPGEYELFSEPNSREIVELITTFVDEEQYPKAAKFSEYFDIQYDIMQASIDFSLVFLGDETWLYTDATDFVPFIFEQLVDDFVIGETEKNAILNSPKRPSTITDSDINNIVNLLNDRYSNGVSDSDRADSLDAITRLKVALEALRDETPYEDHYFFWNHYLPELWRELFPPPPDPELGLNQGSLGDGGGGGGGGGDSGGGTAYSGGDLLPEPGEHFYKLLNLNDRFESRDRTNTLGQVDDLNLPPNTAFMITYYKPDTSEIAVSFFRTPETGQSGRIPVSYFYEIDDSELDTDNDNVPDIAEDIAGTDPNNPDSDGDGVLDGAEMAQDTNPLDNRPTSIGVIASIPTGGSLSSEIGLDHLIARNDLLIGASNSMNSVLVFDISSSLQPLLIGSYRPTGFQVKDIAWQRSLVAVATGSNKLRILDITDPVTPVEFKEITFPGDQVLSVAMRGNYIYAGLNSGKIATVDALTGLVVTDINTIGVPLDIVVNESNLYAYVSNSESLRSIIAFELIGGVFPTERDTYSFDDLNFIEPSKKLFLGEEILFITTNRGYMVFDLSNPNELLIDTIYDFNQFGWKEIVLNGSGLMLAAASTNSVGTPEQLSVDLFDIGPTGFESTYIQTITTPDHTKSITLYNGIAYAGGTRLDVINYLATDTGTVPPTIAISNNSGSEVTEGTFTTIFADVTDDVQVRRVEFYLDGVLISRDGNYPFTTTILVPQLSSGTTSISLSARAFDTAGNSTESNTLSLNIVEDNQPPIVLSAFPKIGGSNLPLDSLGFISTEKLDSDSLNSSNIFLVNAGSDFQLNTDDDFIVTPSSIVASPTNTVVYINYDNDLPPGKYQINVTTGIKDLAGNQAIDSFQSTFQIYGVGEDVDTDGDGMPDELEEMHLVLDPFTGEVISGYDPLNPDTDGDGILDIDEDLDGDGLTNLEELIIGTLINEVDSDSDGLGDKDELEIYKTNPANSDTDRDGLPDGTEINDGLNPLDSDTDGDLLDDGTEKFKGYDPNTPDASLDHTISAPVIIFYKAGSSEIENQGAVSQPVAHENQ